MPSQALELAGLDQAAAKAGDDDLFNFDGRAIGRRLRKRGRSGTDLPRIGLAKHVTAGHRLHPQAFTADQ
jgi:hypothetical protein